MNPYYKSEYCEIWQGSCFDVSPYIGISDMVAVDPPYGTTSCRWDTVLPFSDMWGFIKGHTKKTAALVFTASQPFSSALVMSNPEMFRHEWIWIKNRGSNFANTVREPMKEHESILVFSQGGWTYNKQMQLRTGAGLERTKYKCDFVTSSENYRKFTNKLGNDLQKMRVPSSWQKFNTACGKEKTKHPTQKPVALMEYLIKTYSNEGDIVLDFCMGSGTTGVACKKLKRYFIGIELDNKKLEYCKMAVERIVNTKPLDTTTLFDPLTRKE